MIFSKEYIENGVVCVFNKIKVFSNLEEETLDLIKEKKGNPLSCMNFFGICYEAKASKSLYIDKDIEQFKKYMYVSGKLKLMGKDTRGFLRSNNIEFWYIIMSNNRDLIEFTIRNIEYIAYENKKNEYKKSEAYRFLTRTMVLALKGEWETVIERANIYLENPSKSTYDKYLYLEFEYLKALGEKKEEKMKEVLNIMLDKKVARKQLNDKSTFYDFYLHLYVIMYAKIAMYHGIDLGIDCDVAPKELIDMTPAKEYKEPYEYMKKFDLKKITPEEWLKWIYEYHPHPQILDNRVKKGYFI